MGTILTIPKNRIVPSLAVASFSSLASASHSQDMLASLLENGSSSTGSNVTWLETALPHYSPTRGEDLFVLAIQHMKSLKAKEQDAVDVRSDRDSLLTIKHILSLTGAQLATAMGVSRTAVYQWIEESKSMRSKYRAQLRNLRTLSDQWSEKVGTPISRSTWVNGAQRAQLIEMLTSENGVNLDEAKVFLEQLLTLKPQVEKGHRSILEIIKEKKLSKLPEDVRQAQRNSRRPSARINTDPS
jgi:DNA-binding XRE family transcriptional regulator